MRQQQDSYIEKATVTYTYTDYQTIEPSNQSSASIGTMAVGSLPLAHGYQIRFFFFEIAVTKPDHRCRIFSNIFAGPYAEKKQCRQFRSAFEKFVNSKKFHGRRSRPPTMKAVSPCHSGPTIQLGICASHEKARGF